MDLIPALVFGFQALVFLAFVVVLIIVIVKRVGDKKTEDFEERDN